MLIKIILLVVLVGLGALNRQRSVPALRAAARPARRRAAPGALLRRTLRVEVALVVVVLGVTAALVSYPPPRRALGRAVLGDACGRARWRSS